MQATLVFEVSSRQGLTIDPTPPNWVDVLVGSTVTHQLSVTGGVAPIAWAVVGPPGMSISQTGLLMWTPQSVFAPRSVTVTVTDAG